MDYFFWGYIKYIVNSERVESLPDLRRKITAAIAAVPVDVLSRVWGEVELRFDVCRAVNGAHIGLQRNVYVKAVNKYLQLKLRNSFSDTCITLPMKVE
jgi:hypothetical protein